MLEKLQDKINDYRKKYFCKPEWGYIGRTSLQYTNSRLSTEEQIDPEEDGTITIMGVDFFICDDDVLEGDFHLMPPDSELSRPQSPETKPCIICDKPLEPALDDWNTYQPYGGGELQLIFSYGSTKFDDNLDTTNFRAIICDECGEKMVDKIRSINYNCN